MCMEAKVIFFIIIVTNHNIFFPTNLLQIKVRDIYSTALIEIAVLYIYLYTVK